jgi:uncharacterized protein YdcH (DUF465 family)
MPVPAQEIPGDLMAHDAEFQKLALEHSRYDQQLQQLTRQPYLSSEDILLESQLKKIKLRLKDQMQQLVARQRKGSQPR